MSSYDFIPFDPLEGEARYPEAEPIKKEKRHDDQGSGYEFSRYGEPTTPIKWEKVQDDIEVLYQQYQNIGYGKGIPKLKNKEFTKHVAQFRVQLDLWEQFSKEKVFSKDEIYIRCLREGPKFTEFIKKTRNTTLRGLTSMTATDIEEEYYHPENYTGYNSIIHERYMIHWDDRETVDDVKYCFMPATNEIGRFPEMIERYLRDMKIAPEDFDVSMNAMDALKNTMMYDPVQRRSHLMREFWFDNLDLEEPYYAKRSVVLVYPGGTRDTGVGTPSSIAKVKFINKIVRTILERCRHSANAPSHIANERYKRVLERNLFLHLDFRKYGLTFPRALQNEALRAIGRVFHIDMEPLIIHDFFIEIDGEAYSTERGSVLGWIDPLSELCVHAIIEDLNQTYDLRLDHIGFNDDVEISLYGLSDPETKLEMVRDLVLCTFDSLDVPISLSKTYGSRASIFLERYSYFMEEYNLDMYKEQLTVKAFAMSLVTKHTWKAKMFFASAWAWTKIDYAANRCILTAAKEFGDWEQVSSLTCGGWYDPIETGLNRSFEGMSERERFLGCELRKFKDPAYSSKPTGTSSLASISKTVFKKAIMHGNPPSVGRSKFDMSDTREDLNQEIFNLLATAFIRVQQYEGRNERFLNAFRAAINDLELAAKTKAKLKI
jgi:hypothetical protein